MRNIAERPTNLKGMLVDLLDWGYTEYLLREATHLCSEQISSIFRGNNNLALYKFVLRVWCKEFIREREQEKRRIYEEERGWPDINNWSED